MQLITSRLNKIYSLQPKFWIFCVKICCIDSLSLSNKECFSDPLIMSSFCNFYIFIKVIHLMASELIYEERRCLTSYSWIFSYSWRYTVDENDKLIYEETRKESVSYVSNTITSPLDFVSPSRLPQVMKDFFLPTDFPGIRLTLN